ncbi:hypothetical protein FTO74_07670 [Granulicella sp. WH15]|uniref:hypothetical protein n=1 Tax=Granulicella sp. WH15 TaxID=2602070 RepID=UPI0013675E41|nr:hypothetical protein [Granulicella sp. WH15]QHN03256.1 hypothetical protein FTO74_07670 [Granulicella sp. WH15]
MATYLEQSLAKLKEFEGSVPWMYRDTVGKVTVGVGLMLPDAAAACALPFRSGAGAATKEEIAAEFARVEALAAGRAAGFYRGGLELAAAEIDVKLMGVLTGFDGELRAHLPGFDGMPDGVKLALLDMIYNLGPEGLFQGYPHLMRDVASGAWAAAAAACLRHGPSAARNEWTREQFLSAVVGSIKAEVEGWWERLKSVVRGVMGR